MTASRAALRQLRVLQSTARPQLASSADSAEGTDGGHRGEEGLLLGFTVTDSAGSTGETSDAEYGAHALTVNGECGEPARGGLCGERAGGAETCVLVARLS